MLRRRLLRLALALLVVVPTCAAGVRRDEFLCEEGYARLVQCCPGFTVEGGYCDYNSGCGVTQLPALSPEESDCIRTLDCKNLVAQKICERASVIKPAVTDSNGSRTPAWNERKAVCP